MIHHKRTLVGLDVKKKWRMGLDIGARMISAKEVANHQLAGLHHEIAYTHRRAGRVTEG